jgi:hypothetical protein
MITVFLEPEFWTVVEEFTICFGKEGCIVARLFSGFQQSHSIFLYFLKQLPFLQKLNVSLSNSRVKIAPVDDASK